MLGIVAAGPAVACGRTFSVELTPDVPDDTDAGFLSSLLGDHPGYGLELLRERHGSVIDLTLTGPGPASVCAKIVSDIGRDGRVLGIGAAAAAAGDDAEKN